MESQFSNQLCGASKKYLSIGLLAALLSCGPSRGNDSQDANGDQQTPEGSVSISGAFALYPLANVWAEEFRKEYPDIRLNISAGGAGKGMADVLTGATDIGMFSREITQVEKDKGLWWIAVARDAVVPTISDKNPLLNQLKEEGLTQKELSHMFLDDGDKRWKKSSYKINVYTRSDAAGAADVWAQYLGGKSQEDLKGIAVYGDPGLAEAVRNDDLGIGFNNVNYAFDLNTGKKYPGIEVAPIDLNSNGTLDADEAFYQSLDSITKAIADGRYPSPPARQLYFISRGKPADPAVLAFLKWILEKGQDLVSKNGYVKLSTDVIDAQRQKL
ncbi:MAG TPA: PstS family phosphate ABC transporter substrate-binding protein [Chryseosolibacter sp.]